MDLASYRKKKEYLICVDSDGCVMDTMDIKHICCFGPCMVSEWGLEDWKDEILARWNEINLYTMTRGINRFKGLAAALSEINEKYTRIDGIELFIKWTEESTELSNAAVERVIAQTDTEIFHKVFSWSKAVNTSINKLPLKDKKPFEGAKEGLEYAHRYADIAIVSSANLQAIEEEWQMHGLLNHVDIVMSQNYGSKTSCIRELLKKGYDREKVFMTGDAPGDLEAAMKNTVFYFPILVRHEKDSWIEFKDVAVSKLLSGEFGGDYQEEKIRQFLNNLK